MEKEENRLKYEEPTLEVIVLEQKDIITASGEKGTTINW